MKQEESMFKLHFSWGELAWLKALWELQEGCADTEKGFLNSDITVKSGCSYPLGVKIARVLSANGYLDIKDYAYRQGPPIALYRISQKGIGAVKEDLAAMYEEYRMFFPAG